MNEELFCKIYSSITGEKITSLEDIVEPIIISSKKELYEICKFFHNKGELKALRNVDKFLNK